MSKDWRLVICAVLSIGGHFALAEGLRRLPKHASPPPVRIVSLRVVSPPPLEPPPEPAAEPPAPRPVPHERPRAHAAPPAHTPPPPTDAPPPLHPAVTGVGPATPVFGVTMESTSQAGSGPAMPVGNTGGDFAPVEEAHKGARGPAPVVPVYEVTKMPLPDESCQSRKPPYTEAAKQAAIEGTVVLDLVISETGRVREVHVVSGLGHGLTEAAVATVKSCHFIPGERNGTPVPVRLPGFKYRFVLSDAD
ncbi:MAG TPA: energy transducer TonB [Polyangia bacterium]|nr:energy transducer TonB [Polyangia bacterium]